MVSSRAYDFVHRYGNYGRNVTLVKNRAHAALTDDLCTERTLEISAGDVPANCPIREWLPSPMAAHRFFPKSVAARAAVRFFRLGSRTGGCRRIANFDRPPLDFLCASCSRTVWMFSERSRNSPRLGRTLSRRLVSPGRASEGEAARNPLQARRCRWRLRPSR